ncbi:TIGR00730 family Rossman fold protein [Halovibrio salipaludis]|uniref:Cytokinin riboside 5'-monophosphate phosphoribohydrolase n=1 Tax=Halovibrio salipaludis TaxID=2032626 RepID=A0A2A2FBV7_9GAMM|nr:TIGR00730 family Rossman fold protein [Halovibrio salipaludis]PAU82204.1 TIGR00730 family Rossman fold protein [Halovibrio salipaludis]
MTSICVYCGSRSGHGDDYTDAARQLGKAMAARGFGLVYGGASIGMMGVIADEMLAAGAAVTGVIPESLQQKEVAHDGLTELLVTADMHERKRLMAERADAFIAMPGGLGTLEELFEILTWGQLRFHAKPIGLLNTRGYYDDLIRFLDGTVSEGFVHPRHRAMLTVSQAPEDLLDVLSLH